MWSSADWSRLLALAYPGVRAGFLWGVKVPANLLDIEKPNLEVQGSSGHRMVEV